MKIKVKDYAENLYQLLKTVPGNKEAEAIRQFILLIKKNNHLYLIDKIIIAFTEVYRQQENIAKVEVTSTKELSPGQKNQLLQQFKASLEREVEIAFQTDESLIGGIKVQIDDYLIDGSIKKKLLALKSQ